MRKPNHVLKAVYDARPLRRDREQYLDDSMFRESPFHSLRLQNTRHSTPFRGRALANFENTLFANEMRNMRGKEHLPLTDLAGQSLRGQFVFPAHAYSFNPNPRTIGGSTAPDIPMNLKTGLPLNLFGFKGKTPQRYGKNIQEEGVIYGDLNEEDVVQLNTNPLRHDDIREAGRALLPTHHGRLSGRARADKIEEAMRVLMEAEIPPALYNQEMLDIENIYNADNPNLTTPGYMGAYLQPFRQWEQGEGYRVRDLDRQEELGLISPEQRMLMDDNLGQIDPSGTIYRSEPMEIAMRLLKKLPPHWSRDFDTIKDLRDPKHGIQSMRAMSLEDARNIEQIPLRSGNIEFERNLTDPDITGAESIVPGIAGGNIYDESLVREGGGFVYRPHLAALAPLSQYTDMPSSLRPNVLVASTEKPEFRASKNEGRIQTEGFMPVGMDPNQAYLLSDPTKPFTREDLLQQARIKQAGGIPHHARSDIEIHPLDGYATASRALETLPNENIENPMTEMGTWGQPRVVAGPRDSDVFYRSEPMEIAMRLLKEAAYGSRDEPPTMTRLMQGNYAEKPDACTLCGNSPVVAGAQFRNPLGSINYTHHLCKPCADQYDIMHSADMYKGEPMEIAMRLLKAKYLDENMNNVLYGEQDPVAEPVAEEPPHVHSIQGDNERKRLERQQAMVSFSPLASMINQINPHTNENRITELKQQAEQSVVGDQRSDSKLFPISSMPPKYREDLTPDEQYDDYYSRFSFERPDRVKPQELNDEAREKFPLKFASEPMEIAFQLLKERVSPEAKRHKLEYDKKYESSPERVKYREELNRERRRRHIMGQGGPDMSHTSQHTIVPEDPHTNRARHFKDKGTLL